MVNLFTSPCFMIIALGSKLTLHLSKYAMRLGLFALLSQIKKSTPLSPDYTVAAMFLKITTQSFPRAVFKIVVVSTPCPRKKTSHFYFRHNFAICWDIFCNFWSTLFRTNCWMVEFITYSPPVWGLYLTWRNTWRPSSCCAQCALTPDFIPLSDDTTSTWLMVSEITGFKSCWLIFLEYHARESVPDTQCHSEYRWVETSASSGVAGAGSQTYRCRYQTVVNGDGVLMRVTRVWKLRERYFGQHLRWIYM